MLSETVFKDFLACFLQGDLSMWERVPEDEIEDIERKWKNLDSGDEICVKKFHTGTWDTFFNGRIVENYDTPEEAIERGKAIAGE